MAFKKMVRDKYPPRHWSLVGYPGSGKSTFASQLKAPMVVIDADHRFQEVLHMAAGEVYSLSENATDNVDPNEINTLLAKNMPGAGVKTIVVDSLTAIITPLVVQAMVDHDARRSKNLSASFRTKALAMRQLQDAVTRWGTDVLWIYHLQDSRDGQANEVTRATVSQTEIARLTRSINVQLEVVQDERNHRRGVKVVWARRGRSGMVIWDETGAWQGMPELIEAAMYDGLSADEQDRIEKTTPDYFPNPETAISWAMEAGAFETLPHARNAYEHLKRDRQPGSAREMAQFWVEYVQQRMIQFEEGEAVEDFEQGSSEHQGPLAEDDVDDACPF